MNPEANDPTRSDAAAAFVTAFASAIKNLTIYPAQHPRVAAPVDELLARQRHDWPNGCEMTLLHDTIRVARHLVDSSHLALPWLLQRAREAGIAGVVVEPGCTGEHVLAFARALIAARAGSGQEASTSWPPADAPVRPIMLVVGDRHAADGRDASGSSDAEGDPLGNIAPELAARLREVAAAPEVRELLEGVATTCGDIDDGQQHELHLVGTIGELLPAELPNDVESLTFTVVRVLQKLTRNLERMRQQRQLRNANMMQVAMNVARKFFAREIAMTDADRGLPTGRPGDERYAADLDALLQECAALPEGHDLRLPPPSEFAPEGPYAAVELAGICLHAIQTAPGSELAERRRQQLAALIASHAEALQPLLDAYLAPNASALPTRTAMTLLEALLASPAGAELARRGGHLHEELLVRTFPIVLPVAAELLTTPIEQQRLRAALQRLGTLLANGGVQAAAETGALTRPEVIMLLVETGGPEAHALLAAADVETVPARRALHALVGARRLPLPERAVLTLVPAARLRGGYLRAVLRMTDRGGPNQTYTDDAVRRESAELLMTGLDDALPHREPAVVQAAIQALAMLPGTSPRRLLQRLRRWRWWNLGQRARAIRQAARTAQRSERGRQHTP